MRAITYRDVARKIAQAETEEERESARQLELLYGGIGQETTRERIFVLLEELKCALGLQR